MREFKLNITLLNVLLAFMLSCVISEVYEMDPIAQIISIIGFFVTVISLFISNHLEFKLSRKLFHMENEENLNIKNWIDFRFSIKQISNKITYLIKKTTIMAQDENIDTVKRMQYKMEILDASFDMNNDLLRYHDLLEKLGYQGNAKKTVYDDFYSYVVNKMIENETSFLSFLDNEKDNPYLVTLCDNNDLLNEVIEESDRDYHAAMEAIGNRRNKH